MTMFLNFLKNLLNLQYIGYIICFLLGFLCGAILAKPTINVYTRAMEYML